MNSHERVLTTIAHKEPDRVPLFFNSIEAKFVRAISQGDMIKAWNQILCQSDLALVRREVDRCLKEGMKGGGYMLSIAGSAHEGLQLEALIEMCHYAQEAGIYR